MSDAAILVVEDDSCLREAICETIGSAGHRVLAAADGSAALQLLQTHEVGLVVSDVQMEPMGGDELLKRVKAAQPELPVVLITAYGTIEQAVTAMRAGANDYLVKPFEADVLVEMVERFAQPAADHGELIAVDARSRQLAELARRVAGNDVTVLLSGESGTGKEVYARYIHRHSPRADGPFEAVNCAAIPENMLEATLFGYEKGAFTGAHAANPGKFERAEGGTLLLDEISEMDLTLQAKLLRVLQEREVERVGGRRMIPLDIRILATTNRDLKAEVSKGRFREDLYYRLNVFPLRLPPLRQRTDDILPLARQLLDRHCRGNRPCPTLSKPAQQQLIAYRWPGNVRELDNLLQRSMVLLAGTEIEPAHLHFEAAPDRDNTCQDVEPAEHSAPRLGDELKERERRMILDALQLGNGSRKAAAARLGISPRTLRYKIARLRDAGIDIPANFGAQLAC